MDKLLEQVLKYVPADTVPLVLALVIAYFGTYYAKGFRNYSDTLTSPTFLTAATILAAAFVVWQLQKPDLPKLPEGTKALLLVPRFQNDDGRQIETLFTTQLRAALEHSGKDPQVLQINAYVLDTDTAKLTASTVKSYAVLMDPKIVREGESSPVLCFRLLFVDSGRITTFSAVPTAIDKMDLSALSNVLMTSGGLSLDSTESPIVKRRDALERRVAELSAAVLRNASVVTSENDKFTKSYSNKYALLVGVDRVASGRLPALTSAASDAAAVGKLLREKYGFQINLLLNESATATNVNKMVGKIKSDSSGDDLIVVYYSGASTASRTLQDNSNFIGAPRELILPMFDFTSLDSAENITLNKLIDALREVKNADRLIVIDGCDGTYGTSASTLAPEKGVLSENEFQVISASQDREYAFEDKSGGFFTRSIIAQLEDSYSITTRNLILAVTPQIQALTNGRQLPKMVTISGNSDIILQKLAEKGK